MDLASDLDFLGALGMIRTCDTRFRKPMLYPLSYEGRIWTTVRGCPGPTK